MMRTIGFSRSFVELCRKTEGQLAPALVSLFRPVWFQIWFQITPRNRLRRRHHRVGGPVQQIALLQVARVRQLVEQSLCRMQIG